MPADKPVFLSLAEILRMQPGAVDSPANLPDRAALMPTYEPAPAAAAPAVAAPPAEMVTAPESAAAIRTARLFRAALCDALEGLVGDLVRAVAVDIVAREVEIAPVDVARIVQRTIAERWFDEPLRVRVASADAQIDCGLPVIADPRLEPGDAVLECRYGSVDARLHVRLAALLGELRP